VFLQRRFAHFNGVLGTARLLFFGNLKGLKMLIKHQYLTTSKTT